MHLVQREINLEEEEVIIHLELLEATQKALHQVQKAVLKENNY